jgi:multicomponent Na+:H+ antiporter subunit E
VSAFVGNILLALTWAAMTGVMSPVNIGVGFFIGYLILFFARDLLGTRTYALWVLRLLEFGGFFLKELIKANLLVAHDVVTPSHRMRPGVIAVPLDAETDVEITLLANLISLTPGTITVDVSDDRRMIFIHAMFLEDPEKVRRDIKEGFERRLLEVLR